MVALARDYSVSGKKVTNISEKIMLAAGAMRQ